MERILLLEDDPALQLTLQTRLEMGGYSVDATSTTEEAIGRLADNAYPIVVSDIYIDIEERTGLDLLKAAKERDPSCAVIMMTGMGKVETVMAANAAGAFDYVAKGDGLFDRLTDAVRRAMEARSDDEKEAEDQELPETEMIGVTPVESGPNSPIYEFLADIVRSMAPVIETAGISVRG